VRVRRRLSPIAPSFDVKGNVREGVARERDAPASRRQGSFVPQPRRASRREDEDTESRGAPSRCRAPRERANLSVHVSRVGVPQLALLRAACSANVG